jgi:hypothetical protein
MTLYLDTEFNGFGGELISIGLVSDRGGEFYGVRKLPENLHPWVKANVVPNLHQKAEPDTRLRARLANFIADHDKETIIADWPLDFSGLLSFFCVDDRLVGPSSLSRQPVPQEPLLSDVPHNALSDAKALMLAWAGSLRLAAILRVKG